MNQLGGSSRGRFWENELPFTIESSEKLLWGSFVTENNSLLPALQLCCEVAIVPKHANCYGLLGVEFRPAFRDKVEYQVMYLGQGNDIFVDNLALPSDTVYKGITLEYAEAVVNVLTQSRTTFSIPAGSYCFNVGAYGAVGSSYLFFEKLTQILLRVISNGQLPLREDELDSIVANVIT